MTRPMSRRNALGATPEADGYLGLITFNVDPV